MASGLRETVDCERLSLEGATLERSYALADLPRLGDLLAARVGRLRAKFEFARDEFGRPGATVEIEAVAELRCQRCLAGFRHVVAARSEVEFAAEDRPTPSGSGREPYLRSGGGVILAELAEEEFLLAVPLAPSCAAPESCGRAPRLAVSAEPAEPPTLRPFDGLRDLLKKTDRT
ncbi:MAG TPA: YceD family protein [Steroidobacteraceae bacterium]|nr:YceD family protein [Steroidobacteraceae bacterium]